jgi:hypothetical protein
MCQINSFQKKINMFWNITRTIYSIILLIAFLPKLNFDSFISILSFGFFIIYALSILVISIMESLKFSKVSNLKKIIGGITIFYALLSIYLIIIGFIKMNLGTFLFILLIIWMIFYGLWEIQSSKK